MTLVYLAGLTGAEAAVALGINVGAARLDCTKRGNRCEARNLAILDGVPIQVARQLFNNAMTREPWDSQVSSVPGGEGASEIAAQFMAAW